MDNGTQLVENDRLYPSSLGIWQRFRSIDAEINLVVVEWQVNFDIK